MQRFQKLCRRNDDDNKAASSAASTVIKTDEKKEKKIIIVSSRWDRLYYGLHGPDPLKPVKPKKKKLKNFIISHQDMDMMNYTNFRLIQEKKQEIYILTKINESLMRDHQYKDQDYARLKKKMERLKAESRNKEAAWEKEKKQLLEEIATLKGISV